MTEPDRVAALVDDIVIRARIPSRRERDDLRRELLAHFEDAARAHGSIDAALEQFGPAHEVSTRLQTVYRAQRLLAHGLRVAASVMASILIALAIELAVSRPGAFRSMAALACLIVFILIVWHELHGRRPRSSTIAAKSARWTMGFLALVAWEYGVHHHAGIPFGILRAAMAGGILFIVAASTAAIMAGTDRAFTNVMQSHEV